MLRMLALAVAAAALGWGVSPAQVQAKAKPPPRLTLTPCAVAGSAEEARCGVYHALEDRNRPRGRTLPLKVVVVPARHPIHDAGPIFYIEGGPGAPTTVEAESFIDSPLRERHDIVLIDQRGTGEGHRLGCAGPGNDDDMGSWLESVYRAPYPAQCRAQLEKRADLRLYTTSIAVTDFDEVRRALGYDKINLQGGSYGSRAVLIYLKQYGQHVRSALVSGLVPLEAKLPLFHPGGAQRALERVFSDCAADRSCHKAFPDPAAAFAKLRARLRAHPITVNIPHPETGEPLSVRFTEQRLLSAVRFMLYSTKMQRQLPLAFNRAAAGDLSDFAPGAVFARGANQMIAAGMALSVTCAEDVTRITPAEIDRETSGTFLGSAFVKERVEACDAWPAGLLPADHFDPFMRSMPVLLVSGSHDPVTPKWMGDAYARHFPNSRQLVITAGHSLPPGDCFNSIAAQFFAEASTGKLDTRCIADLHAPPFALPDASSAPAVH